MTSSSDKPKHITIVEYAECPFCLHDEAVSSGPSGFWCPFCEHYFDVSESDKVRTIIEGTFIEKETLEKIADELGAEIIEEEDDGGEA